MTTIPLTAKQAALWRYIKSCKRSPSFEEMSLFMYGRPTGKGAIHVLIDQLEHRGFVRRDPMKARSITATDGPEVDLKRAKTSSLVAELERRGVILELAA